MPELHQDAHDIAYSLSRSKSIEADIYNCIAINPNIMQINCSSQMNILHYLAISSCVPESNFTIILKRLFAYDYHGFINALSTMNYELSTPLHLFLSWKHTSEERLDVLVDILSAIYRRNDMTSQQAFINAVFTKNPQGMNLIQLAFEHKRKSIIDRVISLIELDSALLAKLLSTHDNYGRALPHYTLYHKSHLHFFSLACQTGAHQAIFATDSAHVHPIHYMLKNYKPEYFDILDMILKNTIITNLNIEDHTGHSILHSVINCAVENPELKFLANHLVLRALAHIDANPGLFGYANPFNFINHNGDNILHAACTLGNIAMIANIIQKLPQTQDVVNTHGDKPLSILDTDQAKTLTAELRELNKSSTSDVERFSPSSVAEKAIVSDIYTHASGITP